MSRFGDIDLESLTTPGTPRTRAAALFGGLAILALVNYLDFVGVLGLGWTNHNVGWFATFWTGCMITLTGSREELQKRVKELGALVLVVFGLAAIGGVTSPEVGMTYWYHETLVGQLTWAVAPSVANAGIVVVTVYLVVAALEWGSEYWHLRQTTPEERVLGEEP